MNRYAQVYAQITSNVEVMPGTHLMWIEAPDIARAARPGQFITINCQGLPLRRPFSIHQARQSHVPRQINGGVDNNRPPSEIAVLFKVVGKGTLWLSQRRKGDRIDVLGPLGNGFTIVPSAENLLLVAGGIGIAPLVFLAQYASSQHSISLVHGASSATELYPLMKANVIASEAKQSQEGIRFIPVTEDGTAGEKGMITDLLPHFLDWADQVFACGPVDMYKAMALTLNPSPVKGEEKGEGAERSGLKIKKCQVSLEVRMGCGIGACYGCTINTKKGLRKVCRDGPVFELDDVLWQDVTI